MTVKYHRNSMYRNTPVNKKFLDLYVPPIGSLNKTINVSDVQIEQKYHHRPDLMASDFYGDSRLAWIFQLYNRDKIVDPIYDFVTGTSLVIPENIQKTGL